MLNFLLLPGVLCIEGFATPDDCEVLKKRAREIVDDFDPKTFTVFNTTGEQASCFSPPFHGTPNFRTQFLCNSLLHFGRDAVSGCVLPIVVLWYLQPINISSRPLSASDQKDGAGGCLPLCN